MNHVRETNILKGIWPPILLETGPDGRVRLDAVSAAVEYFAEKGVHGVYTADTASEFYTLEFDEWEALATHFRAVTLEANLPAGIGCTWTNQAGIVRRIERARALKFDNVHLSPPYWLPLNRPAEEKFWSAVALVAGDLPIVVYAGSRGQYELTGEVLQRIRRSCPAIAATKSLGFNAVAMNSLFVQSPDCSHFVHDQVLSLWGGLGAAGSFSNLACLCPAAILELYHAVTNRRWDDAFALQRRINAFYQHGAVPIREAGYMLDKALAALGGVPGITREMRAPYCAVPDELYHTLCDAARRYLPECGL